MEFVVKPYLIYSLDNKATTIIQTRENTFATKNDKLVRFLTELENSQIETVSSTNFMDLFQSKSQAEESLAFLLKTNILKPLKRKYFPKKNDLLFFTNNTDFSKVVNFFKEGKDVEVKKLDGLKKMDEDNSVVLICMNPFSLKILKDVVSQIPKETNNIYKFVFTYGNSIYISNYYSPEWGNPCPLCYFYSIESHLRGSQTGEDFLNFQLMVDLFYKEKGEFEYNGLLSKLDWLPIISQLYKELNDSDKLSTNVDEVLKIDLNNLNLSFDTCYHWEMCDCYE